MNLKACSFLISVQLAGCPALKIQSQCDGAQRLTLLDHERGEKFSPTSRQATGTGP